MEEFLRIMELYKSGYSKTDKRKVLNDMTHEEVVKRTDKILSLLKKEYRDLIINSFIKENKFWWVDYYGTSNYYKKRSYAINGFIALFDTY